MSLNGNATAVTQTCTGIIPDPSSTGLSAGSFAVDGIYDTSSGSNRYLVADSTGRIRAYPIGSAVPSWTADLGGTPTGKPFTMSDQFGTKDLLVPVAMSGSGCGGTCVALLTSTGGAPTFRCSMPTTTSVTSQPVIEAATAVTSRFPDYAFFATSGAGKLYVYNVTNSGPCGQQGVGALGGSAVGSPLVFPGTETSKKGVSTVRDDVFVLVSDGTNTSLQHWSYVENNGDPVLTNVGPTVSLTGQVGGSAAGYAVTPITPNPGANLSLVVAGSSGAIGTARISVSSGPNYASSSGASSTVLAGAVNRSPYWCQCPQGNLIGVGGANGVLYLLTPSLATAYSYDGTPDGSPAINTTPGVDENGDWYFGADDGYVYDVEVPGSGAQQLFKAARFGPGSAIRSSPVVGGDVECGDGPCLYFGSSSNGSYLARIGETRILDIRACVSSAPSSTTCAADPRLWARVELGSPGVVGGTGVFVMGWSYYSP